MVENIDISGVVKKFSSEFGELIDEREKLRHDSARIKARLDEIDRKVLGIQTALQGLNLYINAQEQPTELMKKTTVSIANLMEEIKSNLKVEIPGMDAKKTLTECCRDILKKKADWMSPTEIRDALFAASFDFSNYTSNPLSSIHTTLKRMVPDELISEDRAEGNFYKWKEAQAPEDVLRSVVAERPKKFRRI